MVQTSAAHSDHSQASTLLRLVATHLDSSMSALTLHASDGDRPDILASFNMPALFASRIATLVQHDVLLERELIAADGLAAVDLGPGRGQLPPASEDVSRLTFLCRVEPSVSLALSACRFGPCPNGWEEQASGEIRGWIDSYLRLLWQMHRERSRADVFGKALDLFDFGAMLLDRQGGLLFANDHARRLLDEGDGLRRTGPSVMATDFDDAVRLQTTIQHLGHCAEAAVLPAERASVLLLRRAKGRPLIATLSFLAHSEPGGMGAVILLYLLDPSRDSQAMVAALCRAHGLTGTEAGLVIRLVAGLTIEDAARQMHIQTQTARAYLKQIFAKTDAHRQADLVRIVLNGIVRIK